MTSNDQEWWQAVFDEKYLDTYIDVLTPERTETEVAFIIDKLKLSKGSSILDLACGHGRHSMELAKQGYKVVGVDYSEHFIAIAKREAVAKNIRVEFIQKDMRKICYQKEFDAVINIFTSFGYFKDESDDALVLSNVADALVSGGKFLINLGNMVLKSGILIEEGEPDKEKKVFTSKSSEELSNGVVLDVIDKWDTVTKRWSRKRTWHEKDKKKEYEVDVRLYSLEEITSLLENSGLKVVQVWGDFEGNKFDEKKSKSIIVLSEKV